MESVVAPHQHALSCNWELTRPSLAFWGDVWFSSLRIRLRLQPLLTSRSGVPHLGGSADKFRSFPNIPSTEDRACCLLLGDTFFYKSTKQKKFSDLEKEEEDLSSRLFNVQAFWRRVDDGPLDANHAAPSCRPVRDCSVSNHTFSLSFVAYHRSRRKKTFRSHG